MGQLKGTSKFSNLWGGRSDIQAPLRKGYQGAAKIMGGGEFAGDMAYGAVDLDFPLMVLAGWY